MSWGRERKGREGSRIGMRKKLSFLTSEDGMTLQRSPHLRQEYWMQTTLGRGCDVWQGPSLLLKESPKGADNLKLSAGSTPSRWGNKSFIPQGGVMNGI